MIFRKTACGLTLHGQEGHGLPLPVEWNLRSAAIILILSLLDALAAPADVYLSFAVFLADTQAVAA